MSHFTVLVLGDNPEELLAPFDESIDVEPYDRDELDLADIAKSYTEMAARSDKPDEVARYAAHAAELMTGNDFRIDVALQDWHGAGGHRKREDGVWVEVSRYNPKSKWDWYALGGRWRGSLKIKDDALVSAVVERDAKLGELSWTHSPQWNNGKKHEDEVGWVDQLRRHQLDLDGMIAKKHEHAMRTLMEWDAFCDEHGQPPSLDWLKAAMAVTGFPADLKAKRDAWWGSAWASAAKKLPRENPVSLSYGGLDLDEIRIICEDRNRWVAQREARAIPGYALLDAEHGWMSPGDMGWFGMSSDSEASRIGFWEARRAIIENLDPGTLMGVYDCHI